MTARLRTTSFTNSIFYNISCAFFTNDLLACDARISCLIFVAQSDKPCVCLELVLDRHLQKLMAFFVFCQQHVMLRVPQLKTEGTCPWKLGFPLRPCKECERWWRLDLIRCKKLYWPNVSKKLLCFSSSPFDPRYQRRIWFCYNTVSGFFLSFRWTAYILVQRTHY